MKGDLSQTPVNLAFRLVKGPELHILERIDPSVTASSLFASYLSFNLALMSCALCFKFPAVCRHRITMPLLDEYPSISPEAFISPNATIVGEVELGDKVFIWSGAVIRGDENGAYSRSRFDHQLPNTIACTLLQTDRTFHTANVLEQPKRNASTDLKACFTEVVIGAMSNILENTVVTADSQHTDISIDTDGTGGRVEGLPGKVKIGTFVTIGAK